MSRRERLIVAGAFVALVVFEVWLLWLAEPLLLWLADGRLLPY